MSILDDIALVRDLTGTTDADSHRGYYGAVERVLEFASEASEPLPPSEATLEQVRRWGNANYRLRMAAERRAANYKAIADELTAKLTSLTEGTP